MKRNTVTERIGRCFTGTIKCEFCGNVQKALELYEDDLRSEVDLILCNKCGKRSLETETLK